MTQHLFNGETPSDKAALDGNFTELYGRTSRQQVSGEVTIFDESIRVHRDGDGGTAIFTDNTANLAYNVAVFLTNSGATTLGSISTTLTSVSYNTTSDYRLKADIAPIAASGTFIDALKPCTWNWKATGGPGTGFIADELQSVSPTSVTGTKDAVDAAGKPVYQAVEYGSAEVIAMLVAELQAVRRRLHTLDGQ